MLKPARGAPTTLFRVVFEKMFIFILLVGRWPDKISSRLLCCGTNFAWLPFQCFLYCRQFFSLVNSYFKQTILVSTTWNVTRQLGGPLSGEAVMSLYNQAEKEEGKFCYVALHFYFMLSYLFVFFLAWGGGLPHYSWAFTVFHNDPAKPQDHCGRFRIRTRNLCLRSLVR